MRVGRSVLPDRAAFGALVSSAIAAGAPERVAHEAMGTTLARFPGSGEGAASARAQAYFWGVIRRRALHGDAPEVSRRLVVASLERELREAGHSSDAIRREVVRIHGGAACGLLDAAMDLAGALV